MHKLTMLGLAAVSVLFTGSLAQAQAPGFVFYNGKVVTLDPKSSVASAIAVAGDSIVAVGDDASVRALAGEGTRSIDLNAPA
jgi:predicted amidohydrolase YtcJ